MEPGRRRYHVRLTLPELPIAQGEFRLYAFLGDETALHLYDLRVLKPGFKVVASDYAVGLIRPRYSWSPVEEKSVREILAERSAAGS